MQAAIDSVLPFANCCRTDSYFFTFCYTTINVQEVYRVFQKTDTQFYFWDNFGNSALILTILLLLQAEIYGA